MDSFKSDEPTNTGWGGSDPFNGYFHSSAMFRDDFIVLLNGWAVGIGLYELKLSEAADIIPIAGNGRRSIAEIDRPPAVYKKVIMNGVGAGWRIVPAGATKQNLNLIRIMAVAEDVVFNEVVLSGLNLHSAGGVVHHNVSDNLVPAA